MKKKGGLFKLIKSLSKSEKRYFKLYCSSTKVSSMYLELFDVMDNQLEYDEVLIRRKFDGKKFLNQLHVTKNYLHQLILKVLRNFHGKISKDAQIKDILRNVELLFQRELYDLCDGELARAEKLANSYERDLATIEILSWNRRLAVTRGESSPIDFDLIVGEQEVLLQRQLRVNALWGKVTSPPQFPIDIDGILANPLFTTDPENESLQEHLLKSHFLYSHYVMSNHPQDGEETLINSIHHIEKLPHRIIDDPGAYLTLLNNLVGFYVRNKQFNQVPPLINKIKDIPRQYDVEKESKFAIKLWLRTYNVELELYRDTKDVDAALAIIPEIQRFIEEHTYSVPEVYQIQFWYQFACIYFEALDLDKSLQWVNEIMNKRFTIDKTDLECHARLLNLMIHFDLGNIVVLRYSIDNCRRFLKTRKRYKASNQILLKNLSKLCNCHSNEYSSVFVNLQEELLPLLTNNDLDYIDFDRWIARHIND